MNTPAVNTPQDRHLLRVLADVPQLTTSVKDGLPYRARYSPVLPTKLLTAAELVDFMRDLCWGDVVVRPEDGGYCVVEAHKLVQLK